MRCRIRAQEEKKEEKSKTPRVLFLLQLGRKGTSDRDEGRQSRAGRFVGALAPRSEGGRVFVVVPATTGNRKAQSHWTGHSRVGES